MAEQYNVCFRCHYGANFTEHRQDLEIGLIPKWIECYRFTHPACKSISVKLWFSDNVQQDERSANPLYT